MSEIKRVDTPITNTLMVLEQGDDVLRSPSSLTRRPLKKTTSEGLISLSAEPGNVKFELDTNKQPESVASRCSSAGRIERKLQLFKKKEDTQDQRRNSTDGIFYKSQTDNPLVKKINAITISATTTHTTKVKLSQNENKPSKCESASSESESESDESESDEKEMETSSSNDNKVTASLETKAEFIQCVMNGQYIEAQEICKKILLLEPDNATCKEFHSVIVLKIEQDNMQDSDEDDSDEDDDEDDEDSEEEDDDDDEDGSNTSGSSSSEESEEDSDEEEFTVAPGLNLLMGGLPVQPQPK